MATICIAMPESLAEQGNQFARCIGAGPEDDQTFAHAANTQDAEGNAYIFASGWVVDHFAALATGELAQPAWGCDLEAALEVQALIRLDGLAMPGSVAAVFTNDLEAALALMGLSRIAAE